MTRLCKLLGHLWLLPWTVLGLLLGLGLPRRSSRFLRRDSDDGSLHFLITGPSPIGWYLAAFGFAGVTCGAAIYYRAPWDSCAVTIAHEKCHVAQGLRWGLLFPAAYLVAGLLCLCRGRSFYRDNPFERAARDCGSRARGG